MLLRPDSIPFNFMGCSECNISLSCSQSDDSCQLDMLVFAVYVRADKNVFLNYYTFWFWFKRGCKKDFAHQVSEYCFSMWREFPRPALPSNGCQAVIGRSQFRRLVFSRFKMCYSFDKSLLNCLPLNVPESNLIHLPREKETALTLVLTKKALITKAPLLAVITHKQSNKQMACVFLCAL